MPNPISNIHSRSELYMPTTLDIAMDKPDVAAWLIKKYDNQFMNTFGLDLSMLGQEKAIASDTHTAFSEGHKWDTITVVGNVLTGATQAITIDPDANDRFFPKVGDLIVYPGSGNIEGEVTAIDVTTPAAPVLTVIGGTTPAGVFVDLPAISNGDELVILTNAWGEGTGQPTPTTSLYEQITFKLQIVKGKFGITGTEITNKGWVDVSTTGSKFSHFNIGVIDLDARQYRLEEGALLLGSGNVYAPASGTGLVSSEATLGVQTTKGIIPHITESGGFDNTLTAAAWDVTDLYDVDDYLKSQGNLSGTVLGYLGKDMSRAISAALGALQGFGRDATSTLTEYLGGRGYSDQAAGARAVQMRFMEYLDINRKWCFREIESFSDTRGLGAPGYTFGEYAMYFPLTDVKIGKDGSTKVPLVEVLYKSLDGYSRRREMWDIKGAGGNQIMYNSELDTKVVNMRSHIGLAFYKPNMGYISNRDGV